MNDAIFSCQRETIALQIRGGDRKRRKEAEEEGNKSTGIKGLMRGGEYFIAVGEGKDIQIVNISI